MFVHVAHKIIFSFMSNPSSDGGNATLRSLPLLVYSSMFAYDFFIICFPSLLFCVPLLLKYWFLCVLAAWVYLYSLGHWTWKRVQWSTEARLFYGWVEYKRLKSAISPKYIVHVQIFIQNPTNRSLLSWISFLLPIPLSKNKPFLQSLPPPTSGLLWPLPFPFNVYFPCALIYFSCNLMFLVCMWP